MYIAKTSGSTCAAIRRRAALAEADPSSVVFMNCEPVMQIVAAFLNDLSNDWFHGLPKRPVAKKIFHPLKRGTTTDRSG